MTVPTGKHQGEILAACAVAVAALAAFAVPGAMDTRVAVLDQRVHIAVRHRVDASAAPAVAAAGTALGNVLLAPEGGDAVPALAGVDFDAGFVDEFHFIRQPAAWPG